jgi:translation initiation factor IF-2
VAKTLRVHALAKELGVASKEVIAKCKAEGIELKNHMAAISAGLAESIREWFSVDADVTSIEAASPVDLAKVRKPRRKKAAKKSEAVVATAERAAPETAAAVAEAPPVEADIAVAVVEAAEEPAVAEELPIGPAPEEAEAKSDAELETLAAKAPEEAVPEAKPEPPPPEPIKPAGPQVVPEPALLQGPRVVRVEKPEPIRPRRAGPRPFVPAASMAEPEVAAEGEVARERGRKRKEEVETPRARGRSPRRQGRAAEVVVERLREWRDQDVLDRKERLAGATGHGLRDRRAAERRRQATAGGAAAAPVRKAPVEIIAPIILRDFCAALGVPFNVVLGKLLEHVGKIMTITQSIDAETAELVAYDLGITLTVVAARTALEQLEQEFKSRERANLEPRPPVVAMLGHVDHGKTSLLDRIRRTNVVAGEAGGITQHIGAYRIDRGDWHVTFVDTPGHEAFTSMRARGANLTDVVVLVVAADDGVMPQTVEAINHARAAGVPIVVALNKIDLENVDLNRVYSQLAEQDLAPAEWGGQTDLIKTSAVTGEGIDELVAHLSTLSELLELKADATVPACATVIEAQMQEGQGTVAQILVREGTVTTGQAVTCGPGAGRVRALLDHRGKRVKQALPGTPVQVVGLDELPEPGDSLYQVSDVSQAKALAAEARQRRRREALQVIRKPQSLEELLRGRQEGEVPELNIIVKADGQGSVDALCAKLKSFPADKARVNILHAGVGAISEADVALAQASRAVVIGFHVVAEDHARQSADQGGVEIRLYRVIYEVEDDVRKALEGLLAPEERAEGRGKAEVRQVFNISRVGTVAGCLVADGLVARNHRVRLVRDGRIVVEDAAIGSLRRFKDDVREVRAGLECGIKIEAYDDVKPGDVIESFEKIEVAQQL